MSAPFLLDPTRAESPFPPVELALRDPNGLLAIGGGLEPRRLLNAYRAGIFPWYSEGQPILWWSPDPRSVLFPERLHVSRSLRKTLRQERFALSIDLAFDQVIKQCAATPRPGQDGTWIVPEMTDAYRVLHRLGHAHSAEAWQDGRLVGGLYGVAVGRVFFGESMFSTVTDASKAAFVHLVRNLKQWQFELIDCQMETPHLNSLGAQNIPRDEFIRLLQRACRARPGEASWQIGTVEQGYAGPGS